MSEHKRKEIFNRDVVNVMEQPMFLGADTGVARYDIQRHPVFEQLTEKQLSQFWRPEEVDVTKDRTDFYKLKSFEQNIYSRNLKYQSLLDSVQGRAPTQAFSSLVSDVSLETWIETWTFSETIHSRSYTHIIRNVYNDPSKEFDDIVLDEAIMKRAESVSRYYDDLIEYGDYYTLFGYGVHEVNGKTIDINKKEMIRKIYLTLHSVNALEAIRFYISFAFSFNFFENMGVMEGSAKIMKLIARDEQLHLKGTQYKILQFQKGTDGELYKQVAEECEAEAIEIFMECYRQEREWIDELLKDGCPFGLSKETLVLFLEYLCYGRMKGCGLKPQFESISHPMPWIRSWLNSADIQLAPQEVEVSSYLVGQVDNDLSNEFFDDMRVFIKS